ncbi:hypothetical protein CHS0354_009380 [Potamilus streckersoni]|uniref:Cytochrome P450 n=1 Tax=Potamilus streckersoni TaxID=2493646 RepID=A0AAE0T453_9BIVA|nr:hypothetical protein CHS0354_009380 [Potamilus streckersoni]
MIMLILLFVIFVIYISKIWKRSPTSDFSRIPAVKPRWPLFGNALFFDLTKTHLVLTELSQKYGPVFRIKLYGDEIVVLNDYKSIYTALVANGNEVAGRPSMYRTEHADRNRNSIVWQTYTPKLKMLRKEVHKSLRMFGDGLNSLEDKCLPEVEALIVRIRDTDGHPFDPWDYIYDTTCNVMLLLLLGVRFSYTGDELNRLKEISRLFNHTFGSGSGSRLDMIPWLHILRNQDFSVLKTALNLRNSFWEDKIKDLPRKNDSVVTDLLRLTEDPDLDVTETTVKETFTNLILAGTDTTATAMTCLLLILIHLPEVQDRLQAELDTVVGRERTPCLADRAAMPYLEACLLELLRYISHVPLAVPHSTISDTFIEGQKITADTTIYINLWAMHHDESFWNDPWVFRPERFLDKHGSILPPQHERRRRVLAFGAGRRVCIGEVLAKNRLFLFVSAILQKFRFEAADIPSLPDMDPRTYSLGLVLHPGRFRIKAKRRDS